MNKKTLILSVVYSRLDREPTRAEKKRLSAHYDTITSVSGTDDIEDLVYQLLESISK